MLIRPAEAEDISFAAEIYDSARAFMKASGNSRQWKGEYPNAFDVSEGIKEGASYVCEDSGEVVATFYFKMNADRRTHGEINISEAIKYSCNYFFYEVSELLGIDKIEEYTKLFGLGQKTGIELPGEKTGIVAGRTYASSIGEKWMPGDTLSAAIGQSKNSFTPIQIARYIAILANGGNRIKPHIIKSVITAEGEVIPSEEIDAVVDEILGREEENLPQDLNISKSTLDAIFEGMESVTGDSGGTAYSTFKDFEIKVAGKTGTVQVGGGKADNAWFLGFAPYDSPEIAICAVIENGSHGTYTASIVKAILEEYFALKQENENIETNIIINNNQMW